MGDLSENFSRHEFACKCGCGMDTVDARLLAVLQYLRDETDARITITSGNRCHNHNLKIKGSLNSQHTYSKAADFVVEDHTPSQVYDLLNNWFPDTLGLGVYDGWVHVDSREPMSRWDKRKS